MDLAAAIAACREYVHQHAKAGLDCPCCGTRMKIYKRRLNDGMARALTAIAELSKEHADVDGWLPVGKKSEIMPASVALQLHHWEYPKLKFFGLLESMPAPAANKDGLWRVTPHGVAFLAGKVPARAYVRELKGKVMRISKRRVYLSDVLKTPFDFDDLMNG